MLVWESMPEPETKPRSVASLNVRPPCTVWNDLRLLFPPSVGL